jgi:hypothetical protein
MKKELNYLASKRWEKVGHQELSSTPYLQEIDFSGIFIETRRQVSVELRLFWVVYFFIEALCFCSALGGLHTCLHFLP